SAATRHGARPAGRIARLRAVALDVPQTATERVRRVLLRREDVTSVDVVARRWLTEEPADPRFPDQRAYLDAVRATGAWGRPAHGAPDVRIAVVDSGVDVRHPDLAGKVAGTFNAITRGTDVRDLVGHGTGVASVAAAATGNGVGMSGAGYDSTILAAKVADRTGRIFTDDLAAGIVWAVDSGADVINLSLGGPTSDRLERDAIAYAQRAGVLVVAAAGNSGTRSKQFPAAHPEVLAVGATSANGSVRAPFSSYGPWVDVAAPGRNIVIAAPGGGYETADGTSFASPLVAGEVALLEAFRPGRSAADLANAVTRGANTAKLGFARGLVDFAASLDLLPPDTVPTVSSPADGSTSSGTTTVSVNSGAPRVRLTFADLTTVVAPSGGVATATFDTYGLAGAQQVTATDCSRIDQCAAASAAVTTTVSNAPPVLTSPAEGSAQLGDTIRAAADAPAEAAVRFRVEGADPVVSAAGAVAHTADLPTEGLSDGRHAVSAVLCRRDGTVCDTDTASHVTVSVDRLHPRIARVTTQRLSPNGDGRHDAATVRYLLESRQAVTLRVRNTAGTVVGRRRLGVQSAGPHELVWGGRDAARLKDGPLTLEVSTRTPDGTQAGLATRSITLDRARPAVRHVTSTDRRLFPVRDGYRDGVVVGGTLSERYRWLRLEVRSSSGDRVFARRSPAGAAGRTGVEWDGRSTGGRLLPAGRYSLRLVAQDRAGNRGASATRTVSVSRQQLVRRTGSV
ncbi:MAG: S8 family serine peptidase, partial [Actinomycetes bacterium]